MGKSYTLLQYTYTMNCQGSIDKYITTALICAPDDASFNNIKSRLMNANHVIHFHEIDPSSIVDLTIR